MKLKQSTATNVTVGQFVDSTDGATPETGLTFARADIQLNRNGASAFTQCSTVGSDLAMDGAGGFYSIPLSTTDTNTVGILYIKLVLSGALAVYTRFQIVAADVYESDVTGTIKKQSDVVEMATAVIASGTFVAGAINDTVAPNLDTLLSDIENTVDIIDGKVDTIDTVVDATKVTVDANLNATVSSRSTHNAAAVESLILLTAGQPIQTNASGEVKTSNPASGSAVTDDSIATRLLVNPANKILTDGSGHVTSTNGGGGGGGVDGNHGTGS